MSIFLWRSVFQRGVVKLRIAVAVDLVPLLDIHARNRLFDHSDDPFTQKIGVSFSTLQLDWPLIPLRLAPKCWISGQII